MQIPIAKMGSYIHTNMPTIKSTAKYQTWYGNIAYVHLNISMSQPKKLKQKAGMLQWQASLLSKQWSIINN
jgi:hypothetical protein